MRRQDGVSELLIFCLDIHMKLTPSPLVRMHPPEPDPLRVDVMNGWTFNMPNRVQVFKGPDVNLLGTLLSDLG